jgi:hypothetical protein
MPNSWQLAMRAFSRSNNNTKGIILVLGNNNIIYSCSMSVIDTVVQLHSEPLGCICNGLMHGHCSGMWVCGREAESRTQRSPSLHSLQTDSLKKLSLSLSLSRERDTRQDRQDSLPNHTRLHTSGWCAPVRLAFLLITCALLPMASSTPSTSPAEVTEESSVVEWSEEGLRALPVRELKSRLAERSLSAAGCVEKRDLISRLLSATLDPLR